MLPSTWLRTQAASAMAASETPRAFLMASATCPTPNISISIIRSANCVQRYVIDKLIGDTTCCGLGDIESKQIVRKT